jgi:hypothetical protein
LPAPCNNVKIWDFNTREQLAYPLKHKKYINTNCPSKDLTIFIDTMFLAVLQY